MQPKPILHGLYVITNNDREQTTAGLLQQVTQAIAGGARIVQYRDKSHDFKRRQQQALALRELCHQHQIPLIINDDPELARQAGADGVHLGRDDGSITSAREQLGEQALIGVSCYNQLDSAILAEQAGADYVAFGSFYHSPSKPQAVIAPVSLLEEARERLTIPIVAIGGITVENGANLLAAGATTLAVISGVFGQTNITATTQAYARLFDNNRNHEGSNVYCSKL